MNFFRVLRITLVQIMLGCVALSACVCASATERYTDAVVTQIETSDTSIALFLQYVSGDALPQGNGGSNESIKSFLFLAIGASDIANRAHMLATALVAGSQGTMMRFRWDDTNDRIVVMLLRE